MIQKLPSKYHISKGNKISISKRFLHFHVHYIIVHNSQEWKQAKCPLMGEWIKKK